jgi:UDP-glucose 6-dehydrogenase
MPISGHVHMAAQEIAAAVSRFTVVLIKSTVPAERLPATKITFINVIAALCEKVGGDVARGIGLNHRIGSKFLHAGPSFGGSPDARNQEICSFAEALAVCAG